MTNEIKDYANKASASKAAKKALGEGAKFNVTQLESGRWVFTKARANSGGPVDEVWAFLAKHTSMERKEQVKTLIGKGLNANMVKTQTYRFYKAGGSREAWNAIEKIERDKRHAKQREQAQA